MFDTTPILVGAGQYVDRDGPVPEKSLAPADIAAFVADAALKDCSAERSVGDIIDVLAVARLFEHSVKEKVMWPNPFGCSKNMPGSVAQRLGIKPSRLVYAEVGGETPQRLVNQMAEAIYRNEVRGALITGAEALATIKNARRVGIEFDWNEEVAGDFEDLWPDKPMSSDYENRHGINVPIQVYALFEQVRRNQLGYSTKEYRESIGKLFTTFSEVAEGNPFAQFPTRRSIDEISNVSSENFLLTEPYTKWMVAQDAVNQGAAIVMTSVGMARELSIPESNWIYLTAYADADDLVVSERPNLSASESQGDALSYVVEKSNLKPEKVDLMDLYSCFPIAVTSTCRHLGITPGTRPLTLTGGLPFFGGPGNNYSLHAIAEVVWRLRNKAMGDALIAANGGYLSKHSIGAYSKTITDEWFPSDFRLDRGKNVKVSLTESPNGEGVVESYSAIYQKNKQYGGYIIGRLIETDLRFLAVALPSDAKALGVLFSDNPVGSKVSVTHHDGINRFTAA
tara:strand:+ start:799 stop:2328 length:1530 start_codon:yes stop_codon:yes gene_type:complete